jgi:hypothetical protein
MGSDGGRVGYTRSSVPKKWGELLSLPAGETAALLEKCGNKAVKLLKTRDGVENRRWRQFGQAPLTMFRATGGMFSAPNQRKTQEQSRQVVENTRWVLMAGGLGTRVHRC